MSENVINVYCAGGCGINIGSKKFEADRDKINPGFAKMQTYYIDTSDSNISQNNFKNDNVYLVDISNDPTGPKGGSGKKRDSNHKAISERINDILLNFKPSSTLNVIIHSASGGSGSVIGPLLVSELLARKQPVIVFMIGSHASKIETQNSIRTLESYENIASIKESPVVAMYLENSIEHNRTETDNKVHLGLLITSLIFSGCIKELDDSDLRNFLNYTKVTSFKPRLAYLRPIEGAIKLNKEETIISAVSVTDNTVPPELSYPVEYQATGYIREDNQDVLKDCEKPIQLIILNGTFHTIVNNLKLKMKEFENARNASIDKPIVTEIDDSNDGLVF